MENHCTEKTTPKCTPKNAGCGWMEMDMAGR